MHVLHIFRVDIVHNRLGDGVCCSTGLIVLAVFYASVSSLRDGVCWSIGLIVLAGMIAFVFSLEAYTYTHTSNVLLCVSCHVCYISIQPDVFL